MLGKNFADVVGWKFVRGFDAGGLQSHSHTSGEVEALVGDASWHQLAGKRLKKAMSFVAEAETCVDLTIMAIVLEPLRHLTGVFLSCGRLGQLW